MFWTMFRSDWETMELSQHSEDNEDIIFGIYISLAIVYPCTVRMYVDS